jgi:hypothetical protein
MKKHERQKSKQVYEFMKKWLRKEEMLRKVKSGWNTLKTK